MNPEQIALVQNSFQKILPVADKAAAIFYKRLFELDPSLRSLFKVDIEEQGHKFMAMLEIVVGGLGYVESILPAVQGLGLRHVRYGVPLSSYDTVEVALLWMLSQILDEDFAEETKVAWIDTYDLLAKVMREAAIKAG